MPKYFRPREAPFFYMMMSHNIYSFGLYRLFYSAKNSTIFNLLEKLEKTRFFRWALTWPFRNPILPNPSLPAYYTQFPDYTIWYLSVIRLHLFYTTTFCLLQFHYTTTFIFYDYIYFIRLYLFYTTTFNLRNMVYIFPEIFSTFN